MYIVSDFVGPATKDYLNTISFKNIMVKYWPTETILDEFGEEVVVFDKLITWGYPWINDSVAHKKIYKKIGVNQKFFDDQVIRHLEYRYLTLESNTINSDLTNLEIIDYINQFSPQVFPNHLDPFNPIRVPKPVTNLNPDPYKNNPTQSDLPPLWDKDGWISEILEYHPTSSMRSGSPLSDAQIIAKCHGDNPTEVWFDTDNCHRLTGIAMIDVEGQLFERQHRVIQRLITNEVTLGYTSFHTSQEYVEIIQIEFKFRRIQDTSTSSVEPFLENIKAKIVDIVEFFIAFEEENIRLFHDCDKMLKTPTNSSVDSQLIKMYEYILPPVTNSEVIVRTSALNNGYSADNPLISIRYTYIYDMRAKDFKKYFVQNIKEGLKMKGVSIFKRLLVAVITIITIVLAVLASPFTAGGSLVAAGMVLSGGALVLTGLSMYWASQGDMAAAGMASKASTFIGYAALAVSAVNVYQAFVADLVVQEILATALTEAIAANTSTVVINAAQQIVMQELLIHGAQLVGLSAGVAGAVGLIDTKSASIIGGVSMIVGYSAGFISGLTYPKLNAITEVTEPTGFTKFTTRATSAISSITLKDIDNAFNMYMKLTDTRESDFAKIKELQDTLTASQAEVDAVSADNKGINVDYEHWNSNSFEVNQWQERFFDIVVGQKVHSMTSMFYNS